MNSKPRGVGRSLREINVEIIARKITELAPEMRGDLLAIITTYTERADSSSRHRPIAIAEQQRLWRLDELADALAGQIPT